VKREKKQF